MSQDYLRRGKRHNHQYGKRRDKGSGQGGPAAPILTLVKPVPKSRLRPGTVIWAHIPYADGTGEKTRPAVVDSISGRDVTVRPITTSAKRRNLTHHEVIDLRSAGLAKASGVDIRRVVIDTIEITSIAGELSDEDMERVFDLWTGDLFGEPA